MDYMIVSQDLVKNSIFSVQQYREILSHNIKFDQNGTLGHLCTQLTKSRFYGSQVRGHVILHLN